MGSTTMHLAPHWLRESTLPLLQFSQAIGADSWITIGIDSQNVGDEVAIGTVEDASQPFVPAFAAGSAIDGQDVSMNTSTGGAWYVLNNTPNGVPDEDGRVLIMQLTTSGGLSGTLNAQIFENGNGSSDIRKTFVFDGVGTFTPDGEGDGTGGNACGCTDEARLRTMTHLQITMMAAVSLG